MVVPVYQGIPLINADSASAETGFLHETEHKGVECIQEIVDGPGVPLGYPLVCLDRITDLYNLIERTLNLSFPEHICNSKACAEFNAFNARNCKD